MASRSHSVAGGYRCTDHIGSLVRLLTGRRPAAVLTGAGASTASGIPDYRDVHGNLKHTAPIQYADFMRSADVRRRYWARSHSGWPRFAAAGPNDAHFAIAALEARGVLETVITQNVDGLHGAAGSRCLVELHGTLGTVRCTDCGAGVPRADWQGRLADANPGWYSPGSADKPDGDARLADDDARFEVPDCPACSGVVKPDIVMFGEAVPRDRIRAAFAAVDRASALLVVGSSLMVFSGFRFARYAHEKGIPVAIVNRGRTRADDLAAIRIDDDCGRTLTAVLDRFG